MPLVVNSWSISRDQIRAPETGLYHPITETKLQPDCVVNGFWRSPSRRCGTSPAEQWVAFEAARVLALGHARCLEIRQLAVNLTIPLKSNRSLLWLINWSKCCVSTQQSAQGLPTLCQLSLEPSPNARWGSRFPKSPDLFSRLAATASMTSFIFQIVDCSKDAHSRLSASE